jgi:hypothetical protein
MAPQLVAPLREHTFAPTKPSLSRPDSLGLRITYLECRTLAGAKRRASILGPYTVSLWTVQQIGQFIDVVVAIIAEIGGWPIDVGEDAIPGLWIGSTVSHATAL